jgi:gas vesicle protein
MSEGDEFTAFLVGLIMGGLTGAIAALLLTPQSGEETRALIRDRAIELRDRAQVTAEEAIARAEAIAAEARARADELARELRERYEEVGDEVREPVEIRVEAGGLDGDSTTDAPPPATKG